LTKAATVD